MASVFAFSRSAGVSFCKNNSFSSLFLPRPRGLTARGHIQHRRPSVKKDVLSGEPQPGSKWRILCRPLGFTIMTGAVSFGACTILHYERTRLAYIRSHNSLFSSTSSRKHGDIRDMLNKWWNSLPGGSKTAAVIIFLNTTVFLLWRLPNLQHFMMKWFTMSASSG
ncbi:PREDICTED: presenilins-associated rhomboid-like protein, mitochondrial [Acropora digitifera]|uniref:presenilins-associated rhomboid-like protein, mitochondrial n=1 Tax=Acropora digitifera TaxID=70779 RepID=UPI00077AB188|nr:PREDICTED: presenilins-associated rhomboid-like protein, mitochondrial [Acropora digitifera]